MSFADYRNGLEVEGVQGLAGRQPGFGEMAFQAAATALGNLVFGQCCQKTPDRPAFLVGLGSKRGPDLFDGRQPELSKEQRDTSGIAGIVTSGETAPLGAGLTMPLLLIQGEEDRVTPAEANAELLARAVPDATLVMLPSCGHLPEAEEPARVNELIEQHLCAGSKA